MMRAGRGARYLVFLLFGEVLLVSLLLLHGLVGDAERLVHLVLRLLPGLVGLQVLQLHLPQLLTDRLRLLSGEKNVTKGSQQLKA